MDNITFHPLLLIFYHLIKIKECNIAQGMIFRRKRSEIIHNFSMDVGPGYRYFQKFRGGVQLYMMESKYIISSIFFKLENENGNLVSFNGQSVTFRTSIEKNYFI